MVMVISVSTTGLAINKHYCGGKEKAKSVFFEADKCVNEATKTCKEHVDELEWNRKSCCEDRASFVKQVLNIDLNIDSENNDISIEGFILPAQDNVDFSIQKIKIEGYVYRPPPITKDINILFQVFLL